MYGLEYYLECVDFRFFVWTDSDIMHLKIHIYAGHDLIITKALFSAICIFKNILIISPLPNSYYWHGKKRYSSEDIQEEYSSVQL